MRYPRVIRRLSLLSLPTIALSLAAACGSDQRPVTVLSSGGDSASDPSGGSSGADGDSVDLLLDDFEDGDNYGAVAGSVWSVYGDEGEGGGSRVTSPTGPAIPLGAGHDSSKSMLIEFSFDKKDYVYEPFVGLPLSFAQSYDLSEFEGISYWYRGYAHDIRIETSSVTDYDFFTVSVPAASEWTKLELWLEDFRQGGWGKAVERDFSEAKAVSFHLRGKTPTDQGSLELDDVMMVRTMTLPAVPDMEIRTAAPPNQVQLGDISIQGSFAQFATQALDRGYNITNWLEQEKFSDFGIYDENFIHKVADAGFKSLRLPIDLDLYVTQTSPLQLDDKLWTVLDKMDAWTAKYGLSLTLDYHQYDGNFDVDDEAHTQLMAQLWGAVAAHFAAAQRQDLFFELLNEPELSASAHRAPSQAEWGAVAQSFIDAIRANDDDRAIIFGDVQWYGIDELASREPFADDYMVYAFHFYEPFIFTHQGASWAGMTTTHDIPYPYSEERWSEYYRDFGFSTQTNEAWTLQALRGYYAQGNRAALFNRIAKAKQWAVTHQVPLVCNEFGVYDASSQEADRLNYYRDLIEIFAEQEISWQIWFGVMDLATGKVEPSLSEALQLQ